MMSKIRFKRLECENRILVQDENGQFCILDDEESEEFIACLFGKRNKLKSNIMNYKRKIAKSA